METVLSALCPMATLVTHPQTATLPVGQLDATQRGGAIPAHEQPEIAVCGDTGEDGG